MNKPIEFSYQVSENIYAGEHPLYKKHTSNTSIRLTQFIEFGITDFWDLTTNGESKEYEKMLPEHIHKHSFPIKNFDIPENTQMLIDAFSRLKSYFKKNPTAKLYIHCNGGVGRTGTIVACYYIYFEHLSFAEALQKMRKQYSQSPRSEYMNAPESNTQINFIKEFSNSVNK